MVSERITVNYYGEVFSTSGYGTAGRAYVHALHAAGIDIRVTASGRPPPQIDDELVRSLIGQHTSADFSLVHAIPLFWPRWAYAAPNVISITVWEADPIPRIWSRALSRTVDVWVPCRFNVPPFQKILGKAPFVLPYALPPTNNKGCVSSGDSRLGLKSSDFVFYSIFDWQHRKNPEGTIQAFLKAFPEECDAVLLLKTGATAAGEVQGMLDDLRIRVASKGRVVLWCEPFDDSLIQSLHDRGDCYVSLHRGEGWGYPLFEAAARGKPAVSSAQGGPLDSLDPIGHRFVHCIDQKVQKPYFLFDPQMTWSEPDIAQAARELRWVYEHREQARSNAATTAGALREKYSLERIGETARQRLAGLRSTHCSIGA